MKFIQYLFRTVSLWLLSFVCLLVLPQYTQAFPQKNKISSTYAVIMAHWKVQAGHSGSGRWSARGDKVVFHHGKGNKKTVELYSFATKTRKKIAQTTNGYFPTFGPLGLIVAGIGKDKAWIKPKKPTKKAKKTKKKSKKTKKKSKKVKKKSKVKTRKKLKAKVKKAKKHTKKKKRKIKILKEGITLFDRNRSTVLFPGWQPSYSNKARRLLFSHRGVMYLWDPLKTRRKGLMLLSRGYQPKWAPNGRAIAFLHRPFKQAKDKSFTGGGLLLVDMRFRALKLNKSGGELTWYGNSRLIAYVDNLQKAQKKAHPGKKTGLYAIVMHGKTPVGSFLQVGGRKPHLPPSTKTPGQPIVAYHDNKGVWLLHTSTKKRLLLAPKAHTPRWSSQGQLLVHYANHMVILKPTRTALKALSK